MAQVTLNFPPKHSNNRVEDANIGENVILLPFQHHDVDSPYRASGPIFVRERTKAAQLPKNEIPQMVRHRLLSCRSYDTDGMLIAAEVVAGEELEYSLQRTFAHEFVAYAHIHNAGPGCFNRSVRRA